MQINIKTQCENEQVVLDFFKKINVSVKWSRFLMKITK